MSKPKRVDSDELVDEARLIDTDRQFAVAVIGGGSAGLAAAVAASRSGASPVLIIEREKYLGGVLPQCVHDGFGLHLYGESLTGPEYAERWVQMALDAGVEIALSSTVLSMTQQECDEAQNANYFSDSPKTDVKPFLIDVVGMALGGRVKIEATSVVFATGCRERTRGALQIPGGRPAGVLCAGSAQYMVNVVNQMPGNKVVILGSGDIGLIMARRMFLEGAEVRMVLGQEATGLLRNHIQCIEDFEIPIRYGWGIVSIHGYGQLQGVTMAPLRVDGSFDLNEKQYLRCNVLLLACGLIPERDLLNASGLSVDTPGLFVCGNANVPHDLVDQVTQEGICAGFLASAFVSQVYGKPSPPLPSDLERLKNISVKEPTGKVSDIGKTRQEDSHYVVCTKCPTACIIEVSKDGEVYGNACLRGKEFALQEQKCPMRTFTGTIRVVGGKDRALLSVRSDCPVPKSALKKIAACCARITLVPPIQVGDIVVADVVGTGVSLIATSHCEKVTHG